MKKLVLTLIVVMFSQSFFANETENFLASARSAYANENFEAAIVAYKNYISSNSQKNLKDVYVELANCQFKLNKQDEAVDSIKTAILKYGFNEEDFIYNDKLEQETSSYVLSVLYDDLHQLQKQHKVLVMN
ncbi:MAG: hypothetical protein MUF43_02725 [Flavobacterium sp.]|jgi:tetratricopeptide (TPR) repeat protein|nr:hypothetical protein [Flavobacterium sp.]